MTDGTLQISFEGSSAFLGSNLPVEVRDSLNQLVTRTTGSTILDVPAGLYIVEATLPGGSRHSEVVEVKAGAPTDLVLRRSEVRPAAEDERDETPETPAEDPRAELLEHRACALRERRNSAWLFEPVGEPDETPMATFAIAGTTVSASLPVNPRGKPEESGCVVMFPRQARGVRVEVGFVRQRRVAWTLEGLVKSGDVVSTAEIFRNADDVLYSKYQDPSAAALGGLTLHRMGRIRERLGWVENLARDFPWVADGRVLLAALLSNAPAGAERDRGLDVLLAVAPHRPLFSDGLALLIRLLRSWPDESRQEERSEALAAINANPMTVDWDAMALTMYQEA